MRITEYFEALITDLQFWHQTLPPVLDETMLTEVQGLREKLPVWLDLLQKYHKGVALELLEGLQNSTKLLRDAQRDYMTLHASYCRLYACLVRFRAARQNGQELPWKEAEALLD